MVSNVSIFQNVSTALNHRMLHSQQSNSNEQQQFMMEWPHRSSRVIEWYTIDCRFFVVLCTTVWTRQSSFIYAIHVQSEYHMYKLTSTSLLHLATLNKPVKSLKQLIATNSYSLVVTLPVG